MRTRFILLVVGLLFSSRVQNHAAQGKLDLSPCNLDGVEGEARCGTYEVFEDREAHSGRRIPLKIVVLVATGGERQPDPLFVFTGGPGVPATGSAKFIARTFAPVRRARD